MQGASRHNSQQARAHVFSHSAIAIFERTILALNVLCPALSASLRLFFLADEKGQLSTNGSWP